MVFVSFYGGRKTLRDQQCACYDRGSKSIQKAMQWWPMTLIWPLTCHPITPVLPCDCAAAIVIYFMSRVASILLTTDCTEPEQKFAVVKLGSISVVPVQTLMFSCDFWRLIWANLFRQYCILLAIVLRIFVPCRLTNEADNRWETNQLAIYWLAVQLFKQLIVILSKILLMKTMLLKKK